MFWDKGFTPSQNIEALLKKENATLEEFLDDEDILQECKSMKKSIVDYITRPDVIKRLVELIITEPPIDLPMAERFRHANMACEILTLGLPSLDEKLLSDGDTLRLLYSYLENEPPLNPLLSSFFSKTIIMLFTKKAEQDWFLYQQMCLKLLEYFKSQNNFLDLICKHFGTPIIPDLIMQMIRDVEGGQLKRNLYEWLNEEKLVERLIAIIGNPDEIEKHSNVAEFLCDLIKQGRLLRQSEQEHDSFEPAFDGSNPILRTIEDEKSIESLLNVILEPNAEESAIISSISVVLTLVKPSVSIEDSYSDRLKLIQNREKEIHEQIISTVIRVITPRLKHFNELLRNPPKKTIEIMTTAGMVSPPFGLTRLEVCRVFTVLLQTNNDDIAKAICETDFFDTLLALFKHYCWNNFLHSELEKCVQFIFLTQMASNNNNSTQGSTLVNDGSFSLGSGSSAGSSGSSNSCVTSSSDSSNGSIGGGTAANECLNTGLPTGNSSSGSSSGSSSLSTSDSSSAESGTSVYSCDIVSSGSGSSGGDNGNALYGEEAELAEDAVMKIAPNKDNTSDDDDRVVQLKDATGDETNVDDLQTDVHVVLDEEESKKENIMNVSKVEVAAVEPSAAAVAIHHISPSSLQAHVIIKCKIISKLIDCWQHNKQMESAERGRRLGYMGHLIKMFKHITHCISEYEHIGALIEATLTESAELDLWRSIVNPDDGDFTKALSIQSQMLANCNAHEASSYAHSMSKDCLSDNNTWDYLMSSNVINHLDVFDSNTNFDRNFDQDDDEDDDENYLSSDGHSLFAKASASCTALPSFISNPWDNVDPFGDLTTPGDEEASDEHAVSAGGRDLTPAITPWEADFNADNFADFDAHFSAFQSDLGDGLMSQPNNTDDNNFESRHSLDNTDDQDADHNAEYFKAKLHDTKGNEDNVNDLISGAEPTFKSYDKNANVDKATTARAIPIPAPKTTPQSSPMGAYVAIGSVSPQRRTFKIFQDEDDENSKNEKILSSIWRSLHTVMQDSEDDYEDDEGMWTKPFSSDHQHTSNTTATTSSSTADISTPPAAELVNGDVAENTLTTAAEQFSKTKDVDTKAAEIEQPPPDDDEAMDVTTATKETATTDLPKQCSAMATNPVEIIPPSTT